MKFSEFLLTESKPDFDYKVIEVDMEEDVDVSQYRKYSDYTYTFTLKIGKGDSDVYAYYTALVYDEEASLIKIVDKTIHKKSDDRESILLYKEFKSDAKSFDYKFEELVKEAIYKKLDL